MAAHHVAHLHTHVSAAAHGAAKATLYDGVEKMVAESTAAGMKAAAAKAQSLGTDPTQAREITEAALHDFVETHTEFLKPDVRKQFLALDLRH